MALKRIITKDEHSKLSKDLQSEYKAGDGENMVLDLTDYEDPVKLKQAKDHEKTQRKEAERQMGELKDQLRELTEERDGLLRGAIPKADVERLESGYKTKLAAREKELSGQIEALTLDLNTRLVDNVASTLAGKISTAPAVILPHIKGRLKAEKGEDGKFATRVLDKDGKISALTVEDLEKEFIANKDFAAIITGSKGSGGGAGGSGGGGGATPTKLSDFKNATDEATFANQNPAEYQRMLAAAAQ